ncbi:hypothetical protein ABZ626_38670 [Streptomyces longispororuber]|uniref:hypothetical protein n=1 Tax=Streptomyces longispororuber TaxID=68230 RepID=UPI00340A4E6F
MAILAGSEPVVDPYARSAGRMHIVPRGVVAPHVLPLDAYGEEYPPGQARKEACERVETRLSLYLSADDLLAGLVESFALWECDDPEAEPDDVIRWHAVAGLMIGGGPEHPSTVRAAQEARQSPVFPQMRRMIRRAFGLDVACA